jgi:hypothetical protein
MYAHEFAVFVVGSHWISLGAVQARFVGLKRLLGTVTAFAVLALPVEAFAVLKNKGRLNWIPPVTFKTFVAAMYEIAGYDYGNVGLLALSLDLAVIGVVMGYKSGSEKAAFSARVVAVWAVLPIPIMVTLLYSIRKPLFYSRYPIICVPATILLVAEGIVVLKRVRPSLRWLWLPTTILMLGMSFRATWHSLERPTWTDCNSATLTVLANELPGDAVCFNGNGVEPFLYYLQRKTKITWDSLPRVQYSQGVNCVGNYPGKVSEASSGYRRVWLITTDPTPEQNEWVMNMLVPRYGKPMYRQLFPGPIKIELLPGT